MKNICRLLLPLLILALLLSGCKGGEAQETGEAGTDTTPAPVEDSFPITADFHIICDNNDDAASVSGLYLKKAIEAVYGFTVSLETDYKCPIYDYEIRIGKTNREEKKDVIDALNGSTFYYGILSPHVIVISGTDGVTTDAAVKSFAKDIIGYTGEEEHGGPVNLKVGTEYTYDYQYPVKDFTINGHDIHDFVILNTNTAYTQYVSKIVTAVDKMTGMHLKIVKKAKDVPEGSYVISFEYVSLGSKGIYSYSYQSDEKGNLVFKTSTNSVQGAVSDFISRYLTDYPLMTYSLDFKDKQFGYNVGNEDNGLVLQDTTDRQVCAGVKYSTLNYKDKNGKPVIVCVLTIEPGAATPYMATPHDELPFKAGVLDTPLNMATEAQEKYGWDVCCGVNGDLAEFGLPMGMNVRDGKKYSEPRGFPMFGVNKDGSFFTGYYEDLKSPSQLQTAVGGRFMILRDGLIYDIGHTIDFSYVRHPRTAVGYDKEGRLYIVEVDGRQPSWSNGASLADLALIFLHIGATDAVNIDGGGSSMMYYKNYETGKFVAETKSSDGAYRRVVNSLFFIRNEDYKE